MLKFLGNGSCFNVKNGNTCAYYYNKRKGALFLVDCGESVFEKIITKFKNLKKVIVVITHFHSDHIGSLPSFIFYCNIAFDIKPVIVFPNNSIVELLSKMGVEDNCYVHKKKCKFIDNIYEVEHKENIDSFGYIFDIGNSRVYYSGDSKNLPDEVLTKFIEGRVEIIYHDMTRYEGTGHAYIKDLANVIPENLRKYVYAMHLDDKETEKLALSYGFKIAK